MAAGMARVVDKRRMLKGLLSQKNTAIRPHALHRRTVFGRPASQRPAKGRMFRNPADWLTGTAAKNLVSPIG